jgi:outer membrane lipoprotein LolB
MKQYTCQSTRALLISLLLMLLVGCSQTPSITTKTNKPLLSAPEQWSLKAKLGIRNENESGSVTLDWQQTDLGYTINIQGPLGQGNATINGNDDFIVIEQAGKSPLYSNDASALIKATFGWQIPINDLKFWLRGIANSEQPVDSATYDASGALTSLEQSRWILNYSGYQTVNQWQLPSKIRATQDSTQLTLIIRAWQLL